MLFVREIKHQKEKEEAMANPKGEIMANLPTHKSVREIL